MSNRGRGNCPRCSEGYSNRAKPPSCPKCGYELGGKFQPKKVKSNSAPIVEVCHGLFSCRTTGRDDRCFVTNRDGIWLCTREDCKVSRSIHVNTGLLKEYQCEHIKLAKNYPNASPLRVFTPVLDAYPCSDSIRLELSGIIESLPSNTPSVVQVSEQTFAVFGPATASNPLGFCHVKMNQKVKIGYACSGKDCSGNAAKAKGFSVRSCCLHLHLLLAALRQSTHLAFSDSVPPSTTSCESSSACLSTPVPQQSLSLSSATSAPGLTTCSATTSLTSSTLLSSLSSSTSTSASTSANASNSIQRQSTVLLAEKVRKLPYKIPRELLRGIMARDSCSLLGLSGGWPTVFLPVDEYCGLCHSPLGRETNHPGQQSNDAYLITELNAFSKVDVKVKTCSSKDCLAIHQPIPVDIGIIFNACSPSVSQFFFPKKDAFYHNCRNSCALIGLFLLSIGGHTHAFKIHAMYHQTMADNVTIRYRKKIYVTF